MVSLPYTLQRGCMPSYTGVAHTGKQATRTTIGSLECCLCPFTIKHYGSNILHLLETIEAGPQFRITWCVYINNITNHYTTGAATATTVRTGVRLSLETSAPGKISWFLPYTRIQAIRSYIHARNTNLVAMVTVSIYRRII